MKNINASTFKSGFMPVDFYQLIFPLTFGTFIR